MWLVKQFLCDQKLTSSPPTSVPESAMPDTVTPETQGDLPNMEEATTDFCGFNTLVHLGDGTIRKLNMTNVDDNVAAMLLNARVNLNYSPIELRYHSKQPDLKMYALRDRVSLKVNESLKTHHDILEKGPVVVVRLEDKKRIFSFEYKSSSITEPIAIKYPNHKPGSP
jgi:hypothetical protein